MKKFLYYILKVFLVGLILAYFISELSFWALRRGNFYKPTFVENTIKEKEVDYIILGASTALTGIDTELLDTLTGLKGYNLAIDDTGLPNSYLMLQHFLATGHTTQKVILVPTESSLTQSSSLSDNDYRFLMYNKKRYVQNYYQELEASTENIPVLSQTTYFPFLGLSYFNVELFFPSLVSLFQPNKHNRFNNKGDYSYPKNNFKGEGEKSKKVVIEFDDEYLKKIENLCDRMGVELIVYFPPIYNTEFLISENQLNIVNLTTSFSSSKFFYDKIHINTEGKRKATLLLSEYFKIKY